MNGDSYGISKDTWQKVIVEFEKVSTLKEVILYGSRAKGNYKNGSDIDLCLKGDQVELSDMYQLQLSLDELYLPYTFDVTIYSKISNPDLINHIDRVGKTLYNSADIKLSANSAY
ncbi:MAG: nucleotidyltransferase domain-containing protein [Cyclobacteriaceae bacterium]|nr:nucleotidyltransferase domain-containing protein [Cyclobacteriaceae bacterium]